MKLSKPVYFTKLVLDFGTLCYLVAVLQFNFQFHIYLYTSLLMLNFVLSALLIVRYRFIRKEHILQYVISASFAVYILSSMTSELSRPAFVETIVFALLTPISNLQFYRTATKEARQQI